MQSCYSVDVRAANNSDHEARSICRGPALTSVSDKRLVGRVSCLEGDVKMTLEQEAKFWAMVVADPGTGCWVWGGGIATNGYGVANVRGRTRTAHRLMWEHERGPIPEGLVLDHLCRNRACVNPAHLEAVTLRENILRGEAPTAHRARQTHCKHGHEFTAENTRIRREKGNDNRACRECNRLYLRAYKITAHPDFLTTSATESREAKGGTT